MNEFFTLEYLLSFGGATAVVILVTTVIGMLVGEAVKPHLKWVALVVALGLTMLGAAVTPDPAWTKWIMAAVNGFVVFLAAVGANQLTAERVTARVIGASAGAGARARMSWL